MPLLFNSNVYFEDIILEAIRYYTKVFGNVRAKELCYRYNSATVKGATVGLWPTLAVGNMNTKSKREKSISTPSTDLLIKLTKVRLQVGKKL